MKAVVSTVAAVAMLGVAMPQAHAGDREWATAGKVLAGLTGGLILAKALEPPPVYYATPAPVVVQQPVVYQTVPVQQVVYQTAPAQTVVYQTAPVQVVAQPAPVIANAPTVPVAPTIAQPATVVVPQPVYVQPAPVVYAAPPVVYAAPVVRYVGPPAYCAPSVGFGVHVSLGHGFHHHHRGRW